MRIFIDIETIPDQNPGALDVIRTGIKAPGNYSKPESIEKWLAENAATEAEKIWRKTALSGTSGEIVVIGFAVGDHGDIQTLCRAQGESEAVLLRDFWIMAAEIVTTRLHGHGAGVEYVGHNVAFDLRFLKQRSAVHRVMPSLRILPDARHGAGHLFCTMAEWSGPCEFIGLDALCRALGINSPKSGGFDGSQVYDAWAAGKVEDIAAYCQKDVEAARECYRLLTFADVEQAA